MTTTELELAAPPRVVHLPTMSQRAAKASERLTRALLELGAQGLRTHCSNPGKEHLWLSDVAAERALAAQLCGGCLVIGPCLEAARANRERFGVFGGVDMTPRPHKKTELTE